MPKRYKPRDRSNDVLLRLTKQEKEQLVRLAAMAGLSVNKYLRGIIQQQSVWLGGRTK